MTWREAGTEAGLGDGGEIWKDGMGDQRLGRELHSYIVIYTGTDYQAVTYTIILPSTYTLTNYFKEKLLEILIPWSSFMFYMGKRILIKYKIGIYLVSGMKKNCDRLVGGILGITPMLADLAKEHFLWRPTLVPFHKYPLF